MQILFVKRNIPVTHPIIFLEEDFVPGAQPLLVGSQEVDACTTAKPIGLRNVGVAFE
jgi:hypothetical protein